MSLALQVIVTGLAAGGVYGLVAVGYSVIYRLTGIVHFAYGELIALGVFVTLLVAAGTGPVTQQTAGTARFLVALVVGVGVCVVAGAGSYLFAVQPYLVARLDDRLGRGDHGGRVRDPRDARGDLHAAELRLPRSAAVSPTSGTTAS